MVPRSPRYAAIDPNPDERTNQAQCFDVAAIRPLVDELTIDHGPRALLGEFILHACAECQRRGVRLFFAPISWLYDINRCNQDSWSPLLSIFDHRFGQINRGNSFCIVGLNSNNEIIYTRAARLYHLGHDRADADFGSLTEQMRHLYGQPSDAPNDNESWTLSGQAAVAMRSISGRVSFSGAVWCHPSFRKRGLTSIASSIGRACSQAIWDNDYTVTFMAKSVVEGGHADKTGYSNVSWTVHARNATIGDLDIAVLWIDRNEALNHIAKLLDTVLPQVDRLIVDRGGNQKRVAIS